MQAADVEGEGEFRDKEGWCSWFRCKKKVVGDSVVGTFESVFSED